MHARGKECGRVREMGRAGAPVPGGDETGRAAFGPGVLEWDYSRYTRALGFGKSPGLDNLRRRGCVVVSGRHAFRDEAARHLEQWGADVGWDLLRISARPSTLVPDPVIYQMGVEVTHPDSLIFCAAGQQGTPVVGKRPRSPAMRIPLTAGERWLIAADRVRRRVRCEIATRGIVLFIDDAQYLTPSSLTTLSYLLDAQCAWKSHFLSSPAMIYIAFSLPARHDAWFHETLARFNPLATPFRVREPIGPIPLAAAAKSPDLTVEEEHVAAVLAEAEVALSERSVATLFGASVKQTTDALERKGVIRDRLERGIHSLVVRCDMDSCLTSGKAAAVDSAVREVMAAAGARKGCSAAALVCAGTHQRGTAHCESAITDRCGAAAATVPALIGRRVLVSRSRQRVASPRFCYSIAAHLREYAEARSIVESELASPADLAGNSIEVLEAVLSTGRTVVDRVFDEGFWKNLALPGADPAVADLICVLSELFARLRRMEIEEIAARHQVTVQLFDSVFCADEVRGQTVPEREFQLCATMLWRTYFSLAARRVRGDSLELPSTPVPKLERLLHWGLIPAYVVGSALYAHEGARNSQVFDDSVWGDLGLVRDLQATSGHPADCRVTLGMALGRVIDRGRARWATGLADDVVLLYDFTLPPRGRTMLMHVLHRLFGRIGGGVIEARYMLQRAVGVDGPEALMRTSAMIAVPVLARAGEFAEARRMCSIAAAEPNAPSLSRAMAVIQGVLLDFDSLSWDELGSSTSRLDPAAAPDDRKLRLTIERIHRGYADLSRGRYHAACSAFNMARAHLGARIPGESAALWRIATNGAGCARGLANVCERLAIASTDCADPAEFLVDSFASCGGASVERSLGITALLLEEWACGVRAGNAEAVVSTALSVRRLWGAGFRKSGGTLSAAMERVCPSFYQQLVRSVRPSYSIPMVGDSLALEVEIALETLDAYWDPASASKACSDLDGMLRHLPTVVGSVRHGSGLPAPGDWVEDAALYRGMTASVRQVRDDVPGDPARVVMAGCLDGSSGLWHLMPFVVARRGNVWQVVREVGLHDGRRLGDQRADSTRKAAVSSSREDVRAPARPARDGVLETQLEYVGSSRHACDIREQIHRAAGCSFPILLVGDTGTGKELIARLIHDGGRNRSKPISVANCGSISDSVLEAELFGCVRGAYSSAVSDRDGLFASADGTTLVLDELDSMSPRMQAAVLRVLDNGEYRRLGENLTRRSEFRSIAVASAGLFRKLELGEFRQDLYYRLSAVTVRVPPLSERPSDVSDIAQWYVRKAGRSIDESTLTYLVGLKWPGNVRQLLHCLDVALSFEESNGIDMVSIRRALGASRSLRSQSTEHQCVRAQRAVEEGRRMFDPGDVFSSAEFRAMTNLSIRTAQRHLSRMTSVGAVARSGAGRATRYEATEPIYWPHSGGG